MWIDDWVVCWFDLAYSEGGSLIYATSNRGASDLLHGHHLQHLLYFLYNHQFLLYFLFNHQFPPFIFLSPHILRISLSSKYPSKPFIPIPLPSNASHHSNSRVSQMSLNHGVNLRLSSRNMARSSSGVTQRVSRTSLGLGSTVGEARVKMM